MCAVFQHAAPSGSVEMTSRCTSLASDGYLSRKWSGGLPRQDPGLEEVLIVGVAACAHGDGVGGETPGLRADHDWDQAVGWSEISHLLHDLQCSVLQLRPACIQPPSALISSWDCMGHAKGQLCMI